MNERKKEIIELLKRKGIDVNKLERELMVLLREGGTTAEISSYIRRIIEGERKWK